MNTDTAWGNRTLTHFHATPILAPGIGLPDPPSGATPVLHSATGSP